MLVISLFLVAFLLSFILTPFCRDFFGFLGVVDSPDSGRKRHARPTPRAGGVALVISFLVAVSGFAVARSTRQVHIDGTSIAALLRLLPALVLVFVVGIVDDFKGISPGKKLLGQTVAAVYAVSSGVTISLGEWYTGPSSTIVLGFAAVCWLVLCTNAFNLIDGLDGLAAGVALIASIAFLVVAAVNDQPDLALITLPLIGCLAGFLWYNFNPASIFMGDSGSLSIGFVLGAYALMWSHQSKTGLGRLAPLAVLALPLLDVAVSILRRLLRKQPVFSSDRNHIHHKVQTLGMSQRKAAIALYMFSAVAATMAVLIATLPLVPAVWALGLFGAIAVFGINTLGYIEFGALAAVLLAGDLGRALRTRIFIREYENSLAISTNASDCWKALMVTCKQTHFCYVGLKVGDREFEEEFDCSESASELRVDLAPWGTVVFGFDASARDNTAIIAPLVHRLQDRLNLLGKTAELNLEHAHRMPKRRAAVAG